MPTATSSAIKIDPFFGILAPDDGWVPPIRYLLRRSRLLAIINHIPRSKLLEVGCGAGCLLADIASLGFECIGLETSIQAAALANRIADKIGAKYQISTESIPEWKRAFGVICAFDVLEHIEDDEGAISRWRDWLRPSGRLLISVPAHSSRWGPGDVWAGHYRRYDRERCIELLTSRGLEIEHIECYGFPLANLTEWIGKRLYQKTLNERPANITREEASAESGIQRKAYIERFNIINSLIGRFVLRLNFIIQRLALKTNLGSGYIVLASKP